MTNLPSPDLDVWDSCCLIGVLNNEQDKLPALLAQHNTLRLEKLFWESRPRAVTEVVTLSDGTPAEPKSKEFLDNPYVELLQPTLEVSIKSGNAPIPFRQQTDARVEDESDCRGVSRGSSNRLKSRDSEILATALVYKAQRLTTYDPFPHLPRQRVHHARDGTCHRPTRFLVAQLRSRDRMIGLLARDADDELVNHQRAGQGLAGAFSSLVRTLMVSHHTE